MFMNDGHPSFANQPEDADIVWRYMDLARYLSLIQSSSLHFARADQMSDPWEGSFGPANVAARPELYGEHYEMMARNAAGRLKSTRRMFYINCWHMNQYESAAMWEIYQREGRGVAVRSTWGALTNSITSDRLVYGGRVKYADYLTTVIPEGNAFDAFMHKRLSYAHENEVRLIMLPDFSTTEGSTASGRDAAILPVTTDLHKMIDAVYVAPNAAPWIAETVKNVTGIYGFQFPVEHSDLANDPIA